MDLKYPVKHLRWNLFGKKISSFNTIVFAKSSVLYIWQGLAYASKNVPLITYYLIKNQLFYPIRRNIESLIGVDSQCEETAIERN